VAIGKDAIRCQVLDAAGNAILVDEFQFQEPQVRILEPADGVIAPVQVAVLQDAALVEGSRDYAVGPMALCFDRSVGTELAARPAKQTHEVQFQAKVKHGRHVYCLVGQPIQLEARMDCSQIDTSLTIALDDDD